MTSNIIAREVHMTAGDIEMILTMLAMALVVMNEVHPTHTLKTCVFFASNIKTIHFS